MYNILLIHFVNPSPIRAYRFTWGNTVIGKNKVLKKYKEQFWITIYNLANLQVWALYLSHGIASNEWALMIADIDHIYLWSSELQ